MFLLAFNRGMYYTDNVQDEREIKIYRLAA